ncbi:UNVERIFIED_CONTAM: hypothetical protein GTU68_031608, partial [Idotea baltica]|nr:hypothetical protein [Idotea baltica]
ELIDGLASWWTACHGYNHPHLVEAVKSQLDVMPHVMFGGTQHPQAMRLSKRLATLLPNDLNHVFFSDSGSVAVEVALKMAVQFWINNGVNGKTKFICFKNAYHGDTSGAMAVCDPEEGMHAHFKGYLLEHYPHELPSTPEQLTDFKSFLKKHKDELAGVILEPLVQGAGGMKFHTADALRGINEATRETNLLFIADEVATGFGRTGTMFAIEQAEITPDIICLGKALTGGLLGMAATVASDKVFNAFLSDDPNFALMHGPTYMANPLACAAANASLDLFESEPRIEQALEMEAVFFEALEPCRSLAGVVDVRAKGAIGVIQVEKLNDLDKLKFEFVEAGAWVRPFGDIIYLTPPLSISSGDLGDLKAL